MIIPKTTSPQEKKPKSESTEKLFIKDHLRDLARVFYVWLAFFIIGTALGYIKYSALLSWLVKPLGKPLFYTSPIGGFEAVFKVSALFGFAISLPVLIYQLIKFIEPVSEKLSGKKIYIYPLASFILAIGGVLVSYYLVFPASLNFLAKFGSGQLEALISTSEYFSYVTRYLVGFAVLFQLPLIIYLASLFHDISPKLLISKFRYIFTFSFVIAAILTPTPDLVNQTIMAAPIIFLYVITILILLIKKVIVNHHG